MSEAGEGVEQAQVLQATQETANEAFISPAEFYHERDVKHRLKEQEELRHRSGPEAPHSHRLAAEAARQHGLGQVEKEGAPKSPRHKKGGGGSTYKVLASVHHDEEPGEQR